MSGEYDDDRWSNAEVVRAVKGLMDSLSRFEGETRTSIGNLVTEVATKYVTKELFEARLTPVNEHKNSVQEWVRSLVAPLLVGLIVAYAAHKS